MSQKKNFIFLLLTALGLIAIPLSMVPAQLMNFLTGILTQNTVGDLDVSTVLPYILAFFIASIGVAGVEVIKTILSGIYLENAIERRSLSLYQKIMHTDPTFFRANEPTKISNRVISQSRAIENFHLNLCMGLPLTVIGLLAFAIILFIGLDKDTVIIGKFLPEGFSQAGNWFLATLILLLSPLNAFFLLFDKKIQTVIAESRKADEEVLNRSVESLSNIREVRNHFAFDYLLERLKHVFRNLKSVEIAIVKIEGLFKGFPTVIDGFTKAVLLALGVYLCVSEINLFGITVNKIEWKDYMGFAGMAVVVYGYIGQISMYFFSWRMNRESIRRVKELETLPQKFTEDSDRSSLAVNDIVFDSVNFTTEDGQKILNNINFKIEKGMKVAFVGPSGCGKSTTMNLLVREICSSPGELRLAGKSILDCNFLSLTREIALVQQKASVLDMSLRDNILLGLRRPSDRQIEDNGAVDVSTLDNCQTIDDLDKELIAVVKNVGLDSDMIIKALEGSVSSSRLADTTTRNALKSLRHQCISALPNNDETLIEKFQADQIIEEATVCQNILYGMYNDGDTPTSRYGPQRSLILKQLTDLPVYNDLIKLGYDLFKADQKIALELHVKTSKLGKILDHHRESDDSDQLQISHLDSLSAKHKCLLVDIALDASIVEVKKYINTSFCEKILMCRNQLRSIHNEIEVSSFDCDAILAHLPLKEYLIGGKLRADRTDARKKINSLIKDQYQALGLEELLILIGLDSDAGENAANLSGGQAMKLTIARVLLKQPDLLLLDEATAALDEKSQAQVVRMIEDQYKDKTVISISHRLSTIRNYDQIIVFDRGEVVQQGTYNELIKQAGLFKELVNEEAAGKSEVTKSVNTHGVDEISKLISANSPFSALNSNELALFKRVSTTQVCPQNEILFERGDDGDDYYLILNGQAEFFVRDDCNEMKPVDIYGPGQSFGELALFGQGKRTIGALAKTELKLCVINKKDFGRIIEACPDIATKLLSQIATQVSNLRNELYN